MTSIISKLIEFLSKPINLIIVIATFLTSLALFSANFLPNHILVKLSLIQFLKIYNPYIIIVVLGSFFLLINQTGSLYLNTKKEKKFNNYIRNQQNKLFKDPEALKILTILYNNHPNAVLLPIYNQKVKLLSQYGLIILATNQYPSNDLFNPEMPYILQPIAEEHMNKKINK